MDNKWLQIANIGKCHPDILFYLLYIFAYCPQYMYILLQQKY